MHPLELMPRRWLDYEPPSTCHTGIEEIFAAIAATAAATAPEAAVAAGTAAASTGFFLAPEAIAAGATVAAEGGGIGAASLLPSLSTIGSVASLGGSLLQAKGQADQSAYAEAVARSEAAALRQKANEDAAAGQRTQISRDRQTQLVSSRARALAASSGTLATDPTEVTLEGDIAQQGGYNALSAMYEGMARSRSDTYQADIDLFRARQTAAAAPMQIGGTLLQGIGQLADRRSLRRLYAGAGDTGGFF